MWAKPLDMGKSAVGREVAALPCQPECFPFPPEPGSVPMECFIPTQLHHTQMTLEPRRLRLVSLR